MPMAQRQTLIDEALKRQSPILATQAPTATTGAPQPARGSTDTGGTYGSYTPPGSTTRTANQPGVGQVAPSAVPQAKPAGTVAAAQQDLASQRQPQRQPPQQTQAPQPGVKPPGEYGVGGEGAAAPAPAGSKPPGAADHPDAGPGVTYEDPSNSGSYQGTYDPLAEEGAANYDEIRQQWADILANSEYGLQQQLTGIGAEESRNARRAAEMNAGMGASVGGGFQGGQAQAQLGGELLRSKAIGEHSQQQLELKMTYLQRMMQEATRQKDRELEMELQKEMDATQTAIAAAQNQLAYDMAAQQQSNASGVGSATESKQDTSSKPWNQVPSNSSSANNGMAEATYADWVDAFQHPDPMQVSERLQLFGPEGVDWGTKEEQATQGAIDGMQNLVDSSGQNLPRLTADQEEEARRVSAWFWWKYGHVPSTVELAYYMAYDVAKPKEPTTSYDQDYPAKMVGEGSYGQSAGGGQGAPPTSTPSQAGVSAQGDNGDWWTWDGTQWVWDHKE